MRSEKLLIYLKPKYLGDAVMATPVLRVLSENFNRPHVFVPPHVQTMLLHDSSGYEFLTPGPMHGPLTAWTEALRLRKMKFDIAVLVNRSIRSAFTVRLAGIPKRIGHATEYRGMMLTTRIPYNWKRFEASTYGDLVEAMGIPGDFSRVQLTVTDEELRNGKCLADGATVGVQPGASFPAKTPPAEGLAVAVSRLQAMGCKVVMVGGKEEQPLGDKLQSMVQTPMADLIGKCSLRESMGVIAGLKACIGGSTGIMHIAAAVGCPTVTIFGPTPSSKWGHNYYPHQSIQIPSGDMNDMSSEVVYEAAVKALDAYP